MDIFLFFAQIGDVIGMVGLEPADEIVQQAGSVREDAATL